MVREQRRNNLLLCRLKCSPVTVLCQVLDDYQELLLMHNGLAAQTMLFWHKVKDQLDQDWIDPQPVLFGNCCVG